MCSVDVVFVVVDAHDGEISVEDDVAVGDEGGGGADADVEDGAVLGHFAEEGSVPSCGHGCDEVVIDVRTPVASG